MDGSREQTISNIPVVYEDKWLLVVDKPSGLLTVPTPKKETRTLTSILNQDIDGQKMQYGLHPCHRLDRETSGLIIYAKGRSAQNKMAELFRQRKIDKKYTAFAHGAFFHKEGTIDKKIEGRYACTKYRVLTSRKDFTVLEVAPLSGRTNQIRIHFKEIGHPLVGESRFAFRKDFALKAKRVCLHACGVSFVHPFTGQRISLHSELPVWMKEFLENN